MGVIVFGATGSLGKAVANCFLAEGNQVLGTSFQKKQTSPPTLQLDATQSKDMQKLKEWLDEKNASLDVAVHCIGSVLDHTIQKLSPDDWKHVMDVNLKSAFLLSQAILPRFMKNKRGHFIFVSSWAGYVGRIGQANYSAAKAGLFALTQSIAKEYASRGILANCIVPGIFPSPMTEKLSKDQLDRLLEDATLKRLADLDEIARFIVHLSTMQCVTGQVFHLDGRIQKTF
jgi:3-oxoacyl-[acyl-carrier protein] reductase